ncbi:hypothetical protein JKP88DRAFT_281548 [Tribonema minus]|uniref:Cyclin N-terminal domain-containing protein n=1 Tax=Tribonema minus TaxID=303371 RepID=A0A836CAH0_9STRA|nr:hypothetical protein JKP88DRAFT_281548 [Tribonema minus]
MVLASDILEQDGCRLANDIKRTAALSVNYYDRCCSALDESTRASVACEAQRYGLVGLVCLAIAAKMEEEQQQTIRLRQVCSNVDSACAVEKDIVDCLGYHLAPTLACDILGGLCSALGYPIATDATVAPAAANTPAAAATAAAAAEVHGRAAQLLRAALYDRISLDFGAEVLAVAALLRAQIDEGIGEAHAHAARVCCLALLPASAAAAAVDACCAAFDALLAPATPPPQQQPQQRRKRPASPTTVAGLELESTPPPPTPPSTAGTGGSSGSTCDDASAEAPAARCGPITGRAAAAALPRAPKRPWSCAAGAPLPPPPPPQMPDAATCSAGGGGGITRAQPGCAAQQCQGAAAPRALPRGARFSM